MTSAIEASWAVSLVSRWHFVAAVQLSEGGVILSLPWLRLKAIAHGDLWLADLRLSGLLGLTAAVAVVMHGLLRAFGGYRFAVLVHAGWSCAAGAAAWILATGPLAFWITQAEPDSTLWEVGLPMWLAGGAGILLIRLSAAYAGGILLRAHRLGQAVCIVGNGPEAQACASRLRRDDSGLILLASFAPGSRTDQPAHDDGLPPSIAALQRLIQDRRVDDVIVATSPQDSTDISDLIRHLRHLPVRLLLWPRSIGVRPEWIASDACSLGGMPLLLASNPPLDGWRWVLKDMQDRGLALLLLLFCLPVLLVIAAAVWLSSPGPILFRQEREGYGGRKFRIFKFRTMHVGATPAPDRLVLTARRDRRVFPVGALLRRTSLDELPQLLNVLRGDMWLVGPRPHSPLATAAGLRYPEAVAQYMSRFRVKPGITGWAQVNGWRGTTNTIEQIEQRVAHDLYYIEHWSAWFDMRILMKTLVRGFIDQNAY